MTKIQPVSSAVSDLFFWGRQATIASNVAPNNVATDRLQLQSDSFFVLMSFLGVTNYDQGAGDFIALIGSPAAAARTLVSPPVIPNNFEVMIRYNSDQNMMDTPMPQACLCSNGYRTGVQLPLPIIYAPMTTFDFEFYNTAPTIQTAADKTTVKSLEITFALCGYFVNNDYLATFLKSYAVFSDEANRVANGWIRRFTSVDIPNTITGL